MKSNKIYIIAAILILTGLCMIGATAASVGFNPDRLSTVNYTEKTYIAENEITELTVRDSNTGIEIKTYNGDRVKLVYAENEREKYDITQSDDGLTVEKNVSVSIYDFFNFDFDFMSHALRIYIPEGTEVKLNAVTSNASIQSESIEFSDIELKTSNGKIELTDVNCGGSAVLTTSNSTIKLENITVKDRLDCSTGNGGITLSDIKAGSVEADSSNAPITLGTVSAESLNAETSNGRIEINGLNITREIRLKTSNSGISGKLKGGIGDYSITSSTSNGSNSLPESSSGGNTKLVVRTSNGSIRLEFEDN